MNGPQKFEGAVTGAVVLGFVSIVVFFGGMAFWSVSTQISGAVVAKGHVETKNTRQIIQSTTGGVVENIAVQNGSRVKQGMTLMQLDTSALMLEMNLADTQYFAVLAEQGRVQAIIEDASVIFFDLELLNKAQLDPEVRAHLTAQQAIWDAGQTTEKLTIALSETQRDQITAQIAGLKARKLSLLEQRKLTRADLADQQALFDRELGTASSLRALQMELSRLGGALGDNDAAISRAISKAQEIDDEAIRRHARKLEDAHHLYAELRKRQQSLIQQRQALKGRIDQMTIRAPVSGVVHNLRVQSSRAVVRRAETLLDVIPDGLGLGITAEVSPRYVGLIRLGQPVKLRLSGIARRRTAELSGRISHISPDVIEDLPRGPNHLRVDIALDPQETSGHEPDAPLRLGMPVEVFIVLEPRRPIAFLLEPMADYFRRAFRES